MNKITKLVFASANANKVAEVSVKLGGIPLLGLKDISCDKDIPETASTLEGNAAMKARFVWENYGVNCFADDTGLEIEALGGEPGVISARYAGEERNEALNRALVLEKMKNELNRKARFRTVICLILEGKEYYFEGVVEGKIERMEKGTGGFGYDAIFTPSTNSRTFAQMSLVEKGILSHRGQAIEQLGEFLNSL